MYRISLAFIMLIFLSGCDQQVVENSNIEDLEPFTETPVSATETSTPLSGQETSEPQLSQTATKQVATTTPTLSPSPISASVTPIVCNQAETAVAETMQLENGKITYLNHVLGLEMMYPAHFQLIEDQYLSEAYGFTLLEPNNPESLSFRVGWLYDLEAEQLESRVKQLLENFSTIPIGQRPFTVDGREGILLSPVPGVTESIYIYVPARGRLFELIMAKTSFDEQGHSLLDSVRFFEPTIPLSCLNLPATFQTVPKETPEGIE